MALLSNNPELVGDESLEQWKSVGSGGFGEVFKARHKDWGFDVAIKIPHNVVCNPPPHCNPVNPKEEALCKEAGHMEKASCEFVLRVYGIYQGIRKQGIVMELMERGSVESLLNDLSGPPMWPLAFRLAHQVALGMNFLHSRSLVHQDLKPNNILLNDALNAKVADFGLSRVSTSVLNSNRETRGEIGGSYKYMPPEAFEISYEPVRAFDSYSYGILLWSILTGKEPYPAADYGLVALKVPMGDRPPCEDINLMEAEGLKELVDLIKRCWKKDPLDRPTFKECLKVTENVFSKHKKEIPDAVHQVLTRLDSPTSNQHSKTNVPFSCPLQTPAQAKSKDMVDYVRFTKPEQSSIQLKLKQFKDNILHAIGLARLLAKPKDTLCFRIQHKGSHKKISHCVHVCTEEMSDTDKAKFVDDNRAVLIQNVSEVMAIAEELGDMVHSETYSVVESKGTSQDKMRALYQRTFRAGGVKVKAAFYDVLKNHQPELVEMLGG